MNSNNEQFDKFIRDFNTIQMTAQEKNKMRKNLKLFVRKDTLLQKSPYFTYFSLFQKSLAFALVAILFVSASKPASSKALPGEILYSVKIIHEKIEAASIKKPENKVLFEIKQTEIRIQEAVQLAEALKIIVRQIPMDIRYNNGSVKQTEDIVIIESICHVQDH